MAVPFVLEGWTTVEQPCPDGTVALCLKGRVFGHPRFNSADSVTTSAITGFREEGDVLIVISRNGSEYVLSRPLNGKPFAKKRLMRQLAELNGRMLSSGRHLTETTRVAASREWSAPSPGQEDEAAAQPAEQKSRG
jgi:hypothetical protein